MFNNLSYEQHLSKYFNYDTFRPGQREVVEEIVSGDRDILAIMPTGRGKSICYQLSGLLLPGMTLIISPLVALMKDQVDSLKNIGITQATFLNSQLTAGEQRNRIQGVIQGRYKLVYVAPERLRNQVFLEMIQQVKVTLLVVDEAHCVSQWGHDFRPDYLWIRKFAGSLPEQPRIMALTATATVNVQKDILWQLGIPQAKKIISSSDRPNLYYQVARVHSDTEKRLALANLLKQVMAEGPGSGIIYAATRKDCEQIANWLRTQLGLTVGYYHAGLTPYERTEVQEMFVREELPIVVATNAFGMGIDKANIRFIVHYSLPSSLESYNQEVGRAGRDGQPAQCLLLFAPKDKALQLWMIKNDTIAVKELQAFLLLIKGCQPGSELYLSYEQLAVKGIEETKVRVAISELERVKVLHLLERDGSGVRVEIIQDSLDREVLHNILERINKLTEERLNKLEVMTRWINTTRCRREALLAYFGEEKPESLLRCCDNCSSRETAPMQGETELSQLSRAEKAVLNCVAELPAPLGRTKVADILLGSKRKDILENKLNKQPSYGMLSGLSGRGILQIVDRLLGDGYLESTGGHYPVVVLTKLGKQYCSSTLESRPEEGSLLEMASRSESKPAKVDKLLDKSQENGIEIKDNLKNTISNLLGQGLTKEEIAERVDRSVSTVTKYLAGLIQEGRLPVDRLVSWEQRSLIYKAMEQVGITRLRPIKQLLPDNITYDDISYVLASLKQGSGEENEPAETLL